ncbi:hypothetical protein [Microvirga aerophila]|uniref:Uncharacterized protein n=1 Tax=Microvirga aerophila TaxID=670291 RepID=A0A512C4I6_9HYPH|nr:hypothetical protein [Microvirga aerophila]GEO19109.1 hypothetical protein MAE02_68050 [Microvirga aerophila]
MTMIIIHHLVQNSEAERPVYDAHKPARNLVGLTNGRVFRSADDPNHLVIRSDMTDRNKAVAFAASKK